MDRSTDTTAGHRGRGPKPQNIDWHDMLARIRNAAQRGADRIEIDLDNDLVRGMRVNGTSHGNT
jgi:hypothetical protein